MAGHSSQRALLPLLCAFLFFLTATVSATKPIERDPEAMAAYVDETYKLLEARADFIEIKGIANTVYPRLEIRDLARNGDQFNLYLQGMQRFQAKDKNDPLSYYQIAGIHGVPYIGWNNNVPKHAAGYCPHAQTLFGSWHRPFLALYEQAWYANVLDVVNEFPAGDRERWRNAAASLRMPFWDSARDPQDGGCTVPSVLMQERIEIFHPKTYQTTIDNPLYQYRWGNSLPSEMGTGAPGNNNPYTLRHPIQGTNPLRSNNDEFCNDMNNNRSWLRQRVYALFSSGATWGAVSSSQIGVETSASTGWPDSFESIHDTVHSIAGGQTGGHMWFLDYSSFDPIFWLHHTNIDRLLAMYQVVQPNPNSFVADGEIRQDMAQWNRGEKKNTYSPLVPFTKNKQGQFFTSEEVKQTSRLGYVYPETPVGATKQSVTNAINNLYRPNSQRRKRATVDNYGGRPFQDGDYHTVVSVVANKHALSGSYTIHCFLGSGNSTSNLTSTATATAAPISTAIPIAKNSTGTNYAKLPGYAGSHSILGMTDRKSVV